MWTFGVKKRNAEGQMVVDFVTMIEMAVVNRYFKKRGEHILCRRCYLYKNRSLLGGVRGDYS